MQVPSGILALALLVLAALPATGQDRTDLRFLSLAVGGEHACGIASDSTAYCWGRNQFGQLGDSSNIDRPGPVRVATEFAFKAVSAGDGHTCAISTDDNPYCWGKNNKGQLGVGGTGDRNQPQRVNHAVRRMGAMRVTAISAGGQHTCALIIHRERQDHVYCWGDNSGGQLGVRGQLGQTNDVFTPVAAFGVIRYSALAAGAGHTCGVALSVTSGGLFCWGANSKGQLGIASRTESPVPFPVRRPGKKNFTSVTVGARHSCALTSEGEAYCWGDNSDGQLGTGKGGAMSPASLGESVPFTAINARGETTCGVRREGGVSCWGSNAQGQFGNGGTAGSPTPVSAVPGLTLRTVALGNTHACGLQADGAAFCWGQLPGGTGTPSSEPRRVVRQP